MTAAPPVPRVLLVDDNQGFRYELRLLLEDCGIQVVAEGENGQEAVELASRTDADVVLMDLRMPVMDGLQAARALRDRAPALPVIILSAYEDPALKSEAAAANAYAYLVKGCSALTVLDTIEQAFQTTRA
ncbi:MAG TPA: response regulator transcription factor [Actinomycetes bacterium]|nr:response regulator transcription factor [Actinomycetes bacterium]